MTPESVVFVNTLIMWEEFEYDADFDLDDDFDEELAEFDEFDDELGNIKMPHRRDAEEQHDRVALHQDRNSRRRDLPR